MCTRILANVDDSAIGNDREGKNSHRRHGGVVNHSDRNFDRVGAPLRLVVTNTGSSKHSF